MAALDFPASPVDGQSFTSNGITYYYNANIGTWLTQLVNTNVGASGNTQVLFNDAGVSNGSFGITFDKGANTVSVNQLVTSGSLGVGTNALGYKLTVRTDNASQTNWIGSVNYSAAGAYGAGFLSTVSPTNYSYLYQSGAGNTYLLNYYPGNMIFSTNNATRMMISANGNIGMGYTNMDALAARLYCYGYSGFGASNNGSISLGSRVNWTSTFENNSGGYGLGVNVNAATGVVRLQSQRFDGTATAYDIALQDLGGNVGIGTTGPVTALDVVGGIKGAVTSKTAVASTSGTTVEFTGIPSWAKRITIIFNGVSTNGSSLTQIQIGSGSYASSGYTGYYFISSSYRGAFSSGFIINGLNAAASVLYGTVTLHLVSGNTWVETGTILDSGYALASTQSSGSLALGGALDRVRVIANNGTDAFDAGSVNVFYEG